MEEISGFVDHIRFQNSENSYTVLLLITKDQEELICVGILPGIEAGTSVKLTGNYTDHPSYGRQFKANGYELTMEEDIVAIERYLSSGAIKGIGESMARKIVKKFGEDTFKIMSEEPERLSEIKGISDRIARSIATQFIEKQRLRAAFMFLQQYGISNNLAVKIYDTYGEALYSVLKENPYKMAEDITGVGFKIADEIAAKIGISASSEYRIRCGLLYELTLAMGEGNVYLPKELLLNRASVLLNMDISFIEPEFDFLAINKQIVINHNNIYLYRAYYTELACAKMLKDLDITMDEADYLREVPRIKEVISNIVKTQGIEVDDLQQNAVLQCVKYGVTVISGGPGTGKTTTINTIIRFFEEEDMDILLAAPTGRAAKRMQEATGYEAKTIHRLLEVNGANSEDDRKLFFDRNEENPLEADVVIIDEMSMVDIYLFRYLLQAVSVGTRLILVGDVDQLPSVGPGQVLKDIIDSGAFHSIMLKKVFRQDEESDIILNAHKINHGEQISLDNKSRDFFFLERNDANVIYKHMIQLIRDKLPGYVNAKSMDIQVLTPMRKGLLGVEVLNQILQKYLNPEDSTKKEYQTGDKLFREGDKVMQIKNNYQMVWEIAGKHGIVIDEGQGVFNGDTGYIKEINTIGQYIKVRFDENKDVEYPFNNLDELELSYAVTIHKSQGSEYPAVIIPVMSGPRLLLNRNLLYTGVTRARKLVTLIGSSKVVEDMIRNERVNDRYSSLAERINEV